MSTASPQLSGIAELPHLGVIRATGADAVTFLQGQLTQDVALLKPDENRLAAFCNAKGRMQASFVMFKRGTGESQEVLLVCSLDILPQTLRRLSMFVMRAKAKLSDATAEFRLLGIAGDAVAQVAAAPLSAGATVEVGDASVVCLHPGAGHALALWCAPIAAPAPPAETPRIDTEAWRWLGVQSGIAMITLPIFEALVPQMLNYESVGGVSFKKGCYPGQEIVARSQFRGTLKRRAYVVHGDGAAPPPGQEVFHAGDAEQPCGLVASSAPHPAGGFDAIVSMQTSAATDAGPGRLRVGSAAGTALSLLALPYPLLEDI